MGSVGRMAMTAILDIDGTLVDTNYQHALAWFRAFRRYDVIIPIWRLHRHVGMGGDHLVAAVAGEAVEKEMGDGIRDTEKECYQQLIDEVVPMQGARELIVDLKRRGHSVVLASSAKSDEADHYLDLVEARTIVDAWTTSADVDATKPEPDLVQVALDKAGGGESVMVGDSTWDCEAARRAGIETLAVLTGGFSEQELIDAGAAAVYESIEELRQNLDRSPLR